MAFTQITALTEMEQSVDLYLLINESCHQRMSSIYGCEKRVLTPEEIDDILNVIQPCNANIPSDDVPTQNARDSLRLQLVKIKLYPDLIPAFKDQIQKQYYRSMLQPGEMVGVIAASSIGEQNTQASLNR